MELSGIRPDRGYSLRKNDVPETTQTEWYHFVADKIKEICRFSIERAANLDQLLDTADIFERTAGIGIVHGRGDGEGAAHADQVAKNHSL
jgi:hypothetical protein